MITRLNISFFLCTMVLLLAIAPIEVNGQVLLDKSIQLSGSNPSDRQIENISSPTEQTNLVDAESVIKNSLTYGNASSAGTDSILITLNPTPTAYEMGMVLAFKAPSTSSGSVTIKLNTLGFVPLRKGPVDLIEAGDIQSGQIVLCYFDGTGFQLHANKLRSCPAGFVAVNEKYCIEQDERAIAIFWDAVVACGDVGARLCSWGEWYYACQKGGLGLLNMSDDREWVNSATNNAQQVKVVGNGSCESGDVGLAPSSNYSYRCCYSK